MTTVASRPQAASRAVLAALPGLVARVAHDLNNHLALILGKSELALMLDDPQRYRGGMSEICEAGQDARTLIADLQTVVAWATSPGDEEKTALSDVLGLARRLADRGCRQHGIELKVEGAEGQVPTRVAGTLALVAWRLLTRTVERRAGSIETAERWTLSGAGPGEVTLTTPRPVWEVAERAEIARAVRTQAPGDAPDAPLAADLVEFGASIEFDGNLARVRV